MIRILSRAPRRTARPRVLALLALLAFVATLASPALAAGGQTGNLNGTVIDAATKAPVAGAAVAAVSPSGVYKTRTDARGQFSILGLSIDTYSLSVEAPGYDIYSNAGVTIIGDQSLGLGTLALTKQLKTIGRVTTRSASSAFQPTQTVDSITISGARIAQTTGKAASTDESALVLAAPGASLTSTGAITIRGGLRTETGFQLDGIPITEPFFSQNGTNGRFNGIGAVQIVEGAGDATQGNVGGGVVNLTPKRGTYPGFGLLDAEIGAPNAYHQGQFEYGLATRDGKISDYISYNQYQQDIYYGVRNTDAAAYGNFYSASQERNDDLINNFIFKFGKNNSNSLQILYQNRDLRQYAPLGGLNYGGANPIAFYPYNPAAYGPLGLDAAVGGAANLAEILGTVPGQPNGNIRPTSQELAFNPTQVLKFEFDSNIDPTTFLALRTYNFRTLQGNTSIIGGGAPSASGAAYPGDTNPTWSQTGGNRTGVSGELTKSFAQSNTATLSVSYENQHPIWDQYAPFNLAQLMTGAPGGGAPSLADFLPFNPDGSCPIAGGCYVASVLGNANLPKLPISGINYNRSDFQVFGVGLRDQITVGQKLKLDLGVREEGANYKFGRNPYNPTDLTNPSDVDPSAITKKYLNPRDTEPRAAIAYQFGRDDAVRASYGRSVIFLNAQTAGTPAALYNGSNTALANVPALDTAANPACGSGTNNARAAATGSPFFKCANYAQELYWLYDQNFDAPDLGAAEAQFASNYDFTYQHQFKNGAGLRLTPFYKLSTGLPSFALVRQTTDPVTGQILSQVFTVNNEGINRTTGVELGFTTPDVKYGFSGFFSATYQNVLGSAPPLLGGEDALPINGSGSLALGDVYRAGYVSPFTIRTGGTYKTKSGLSFTPTLQYDRGYPFNVGDTIASSRVINGVFQNIPQVNFGAGTTKIGGYLGATGPGVATNYVDPAFPGNSLRPNIAATRGTPSTPSSGGALYKPTLTANFTTQYTSGRNTIGIQIQNLFGNEYNGVIPQVNPFYQAVATGVSGPQTGQLPQTNPTFQGGIYQNRGYANVPTDAYAYRNGAYLIVPGAPTRLTFFYQLAL